MRRYQIIAITPEDEATSYHVYDTAIDLEVALCDSYQDAEVFRSIRTAIDGCPQLPYWKLY